MKLTLIHPCIGRIPGKDYIRSWQMEPLPMAYIAGMTPDDVDITFYDDRMEEIDYDHPADLVAISIETYTAKRAYQIASEFRKRNVPVVMGGFHATLQPDEVAEYADTLVIGEAEGVWPTLIEDFKKGTLKDIYKNDQRPVLNCVTPDRSIFKGKRYLKLGLVELGRGCTFKCDFCAIQSVFNSTTNYRDLDIVIQEIKELKKSKKLFFFVDDNIVSNPKRLKEFLRKLIPLNIKWVSQGTITMANDEELLKLMVDSGCQGVLVGFESLEKENLKDMNKGFNNIEGGLEKSIKKLHRFGIRLYATFVFGYKHDTKETINKTIAFCKKLKIFMVAFNHLTPFPGTPLYKKLEQDDKLLYDKWWLDDRYKYGQVPFKTELDPEWISNACVDARKSFYSIPSIIRRAFTKNNFLSPSMTSTYFFINILLRKEAAQRENYPLGDEAFEDQLIKVNKIGVR
jgi:radical SAM superfamily enzyme YgiQ (UPF0313 family)